MSKSTETKKARQIQKIAGPSVSYSTCLRLLRERGCEEAVKQVETWNVAADEELKATRT